MVYTYIQNNFISVYPSPCSLMIYIILSAALESPRFDPSNARNRVIIVNDESVRRDLKLTARVE